MVAMVLAQVTLTIHRIGRRIGEIESYATALTGVNVNLDQSASLIIDVVYVQSLDTELSIVERLQQ